MEEKYNNNTINSIAEAVVVWGISDDFEDLDDSFDDLETLDLLNDIVTAVINFSNVFEFEFEQIFSRNCNEKMSDKQFIDFVRTRCNLLGNIKGYFGYVMTCAFVREIVYRFKNHFECSHFCILAQACLAEFLENKFKECNSWNGFLTYCKGINEQISEKFPSQALFCDKSLCVDLCMEPLSTSENADPLVRSTEEEKANDLLKSYETANDTSNELVTSDVDRMNTVNMSVHTNSWNFNLDKLLYGTSVSRKKSDTLLDISNAISEMCFEDGHELCKTAENNTTDSDCSSDSTDTDEEKEMDAMYNILMPDVELIEEVFNRIEDCFNVPEKLDDESNVSNMDESCGLESDILDENFGNKLTFGILPNNETGHVEMPNQNFHQNCSTKEPYVRRWCSRCNEVNFNSSQNLILIS